MANKIVCFNLLQGSRNKCRHLILEKAMAGGKDLNWLVNVTLKHKCDNSYLFSFVFFGCKVLTVNYVSV